MSSFPPRCSTCGRHHRPNCEALGFEAVRKVWVVEPTGYDNYGYFGVYGSLEAAKASCGRVKWEQTTSGDWHSAGEWQDGYSISEDLLLDARD